VTVTTPTQVTVFNPNDKTMHGEQQKLKSFVLAIPEIF